MCAILESSGFGIFLGPCVADENVPLVHLVAGV